MHPNTILLIAAGLLNGTAAFRCAIGSAGSCTFRKMPTEELTRCAITCNVRGLFAECSCPLNFPNRAEWIDTMRNECITQTQFSFRSQCQNADPNRVIRIKRPAELDSVSGLEE
ncbi:hypothetical protein MCOR27_003797 [Pyricularia oryzae]|uniref:Extracellular membrane protein CFEM domain-containing protein n=4 Tax=Pyricularia TaxID=48558 RepID=A0ABQ8NS05_PYRGI|nr:uncharacterized protein MGG_07986 [Pyricularia oryzae 70-15]KAH8839343.1 hypothetical protein MCOR01_008548 [Pyricularia oryzae]KAI6301247.1 hypothetical protein MCOR33_003194 [Pyricularia grisea]EHA55132.1 hypothetical protein MGG_07986 [Pyricularia oryzae 70-15]KAH9439193.1 hypothetical protein MCOR02_002763 [Pyricularia oryzae]KAI6259030.1 hypothetical protein MCOR19_004590 [Pyricularia oryzae]